MPQPAPTAADLALLDPDGRFRERVIADRAKLIELAGAPLAISLPDIQRIAHQLAGAAGTFGYAEIGECAIALDDALRDSAAPPEVPGLFEELLRALARV